MVCVQGLAEVKALGPNAKNGFSQCMKNKWIKVVKDESKIPSITRLVKPLSLTVANWRFFFRALALCTGWAISALVKRVN